MIQLSSIAAVMDATPIVIMEQYGVQPSCYGTLLLRIFTPSIIKVQQIHK